jgi:hypothetical protein
MAWIFVYLSKSTGNCVLHVLNGIMCSFSTLVIYTFRVVYKMNTLFLLYSTHSFVFVMDEDSVLCEVHAAFLCAI